MLGNGGNSAVVLLTCLWPLSCSYVGPGPHPPEPQCIEDCDLWEAKKDGGRWTPGHCCSFTGDLSYCCETTLRSVLVFCAYCAIPLVVACCCCLCAYIKSKQDKASMVAPTPSGPATTPESTGQFIGDEVTLKGVLASG
mmetsp:Transcript_52631/g.97431  ORF Transcript_52631/g.97431 Transcript_52631/m.97431 type:complete len:139 (-) Transcript_52631:124-540(-)